MYRTPGRRARSPDSLSPYRGSPRSPEERSWSRDPSPPQRRRSPRRRSRSPRRRSRSRSPVRRGRSRSTDRRSRSRSRHRSRPRGHSRSKSRSRAARSRSRTRRSPAQYRRRSPGDEYEGRDSPSYRSSLAADPLTAEHRPGVSPREQDRSGDGKLGNDSSLRSCSVDVLSAALPMPKKSILKKRPEVESSSCDQSPQVDMFSGNIDVRSVSSMGAGKSAEMNNLTTESPLSSTVKLGTLPSSTSALAAAAQSPEAPLPRGSTPLTVAPTNWTLSGDFVVTGKVDSKTAPCNMSDSSMLSSYSSTVGNPPPQSAPPSQTANESGSGLLPHEQNYTSSSLLSKTPDIKQRSSSEIEDEELFLYGDEEEKKPEEKKAPPEQTAAAKSSGNKQEFEKIHDLLKTIGLDIGVAEIGKLAVRTQERLHGKIAAPKMTQPAAEQPPSGPAAPAAEIKAKMPQPKAEKKAGPAAKTKPLVKPVPTEPPPVTLPSPAPSPQEKPQVIVKKPLPKEIIAAPKIEVPLPPPITAPVPEPTPPPISPSQLPVYPPYTPPPMVPGYSMPPSYNPYAPYVSYAPPSSWNMYPSMPPPTHIPPPPSSLISVPISAAAPVYIPRSNLRVIETTADLAEATVKSDSKTPIATLLAQQEADRKNKETEKIKVLKELDSVRKEHKAKRGTLKSLSAKVEQLRIQQGILLRKKRREKDGHKDPLLEELNNVLESAQKQITTLSEEISTTNHKQQQLTKVAEILGVSPAELAEKSDPKEERRSASPALPRDSDNESRTSSDSSKSANDLKSRSDPVSDAKAKSSSIVGADAKLLGTTHPTSGSEKSEEKSKDPAPKPRPDPAPKPRPDPAPKPSPDPKKALEPHSPCISRDKSRSKSPQPTTPSSKTPTNSDRSPSFELSEIFEYYDCGSHWCEDCNEICMTLHEFLLHLHDQKHTQSIKEERRPWVKKKPQDLSSVKKQKVNVPLKGPEFLVPLTGFYCELCEEMLPDPTAANEHLRAYAHNDKYKKHTDAHINYEATRREKKKEKLTAAQEMDRRIADHKRKIAEMKFEVPSNGQSKKAKKEEEKKAQSKPHASASPSSSDQRQNKTPEKEPAKNTTPGKIIWKTAEKKQDPIITAKVEAAPNSPKEETSKAPSSKTKSFVIKLLGKHSTLPGNALSPSHSTSSTTVSSTTSTTSTSVSPTSTATAQPKVRPNLPGLANVRLPTPQVTMSKPAPLNTFLSIKSSNATSKSIPIVKNKPTSVFSQDLVSKAFGGEVVILKEHVKPESKDKGPNKEPKKKVEHITKPVQVTNKQGLLNVRKKETVVKREVRNVKESAVSKPEVKNVKESPVSKPSSSWFSQKSKSEPVSTSTSHTNVFGPIRSSASKRPAKVQDTSNIKSPVPSPISSSLSKNTKSEGTINPPNPQTNKAATTLRKEKDQPEKAAPSRSEKTPQEVKASASINPASDQQEHLAVQQIKAKDTNVQNLPVTKPLPTAITGINSDNPNKPVSTPLPPMQQAKQTFNATTKLNQKFKKAPLSLPSSLFGYVQDASCKDIKITSREAPKPNNGRDNADNRLAEFVWKEISSLTTTRSPASPGAMQQELDSYYKLIASEDDPEDLTTSEDQDLEVAPQPTNITRMSLHTKVEIPPEKKVKLEKAHAPVKTQIRAAVAEVSGEDVDDSDMACEVPDAALSSVYHTSALKFMQSSYASSSSQQLFSLASAKNSINKDRSTETQEAASENFMEDLSAFVTCDSD